jgi:hypothetical protein
MTEEWCEQRDYVEDDKMTRCSVCGRRLKPQETWQMDSTENNTILHLPEYRLPPHKKKGYKIKRKKGHNRRKNGNYKRSS